MNMQVLECGEVLVHRSSHGEITITLPAFDPDKGYYEHLAILDKIKSSVEREYERIMDQVFA